MFEFCIDVVNTITGVKLGYIPMSASCYLLPTRLGLFSRDNLYQTIEEVTNGQYARGERHV